MRISFRIIIFVSDLQMVKFCEIGCYFLIYRNWTILVEFGKNVQTIISICPLLNMSLIGISIIRPYVKEGFSKATRKVRPKLVWRSGQ